MCLIDIPSSKSLPSNQGMEVCPQVCSPMKDQVAGEEKKCSIITCPKVAGSTTMLVLVPEAED